MTEAPFDARRIRNPLWLDDYYVKLDPRTRPPLAGIESMLAAGVDRYRARLESFLAYVPDLLTIELELGRARPGEPAWVNGAFPGVDIVALFGMVASTRPALYLEVGSGTSTLVAAMAKRLHSPGTRIVSIDPQPRAEVDAVCDQVVRCQLQDADLTVFDSLAAGDIVFIDGSHRLFQNSDVSTFYLEILPRLPAGVIIHHHDIFLPDDYPAMWAERYYTEQYLLALVLTFAPDAFEVILPNSWISTRTDMERMFSAIWDRSGREVEGRHGGSFWMVKR